jgi:hypothetical protein
VEAAAGEPDRQQGVPHVAFRLRQGRLVTHHKAFHLAQILIDRIARLRGPLQFLHNIAHKQRQHVGLKERCGEVEAGEQHEAFMRHGKLRADLFERMAHDRYGLTLRCTHAGTPNNWPYNRDVVRK